jgi:hypothetical protein
MTSTARGHHCGAIGAIDPRLAPARNALVQWKRGHDGGIPIILEIK